MVMSLCLSFSHLFVFLFYSLVITLALLLFSLFPADLFSLHPPLVNFFCITYFDFASLPLTEVDVSCWLAYLIGLIHLQNGNIIHFGREYISALSEIITFWRSCILVNDKTSKH